MKVIRRIYLAIMFVFIYAPIFVMILFSFNEGESRGKLTGLSLRWYKAIPESEYTSALGNTFLLAISSAIISVIIGTYAAIIINKLSSGKKYDVMQIVNIPMLNAEIVTGVSLMMLFTTLSVTLGFGTLLLAHVIFSVPYVVLSVMPRLRGVSKSVYEAALDLGAKPSFAFRKVVIPELIPGIISGFAMAFMLSIDDFIISFFTAGPDFMTLATKIYSAKTGVKIEVNALLTILVLIVTVFMIIYTIFKRKAEKKGVEKK